MLVTKCFFLDAKTEGGLAAFPIKLECIIEVTGHSERDGRGWSFYAKNELSSFDIILGDTRYSDASLEAESKCSFSDFLLKKIENLTLDDMDIYEDDLKSECEDEVFE